jgi:hypothetical protein
MVEEKQVIDEKEELRKRLLRREPRGDVSFFRSFILPYVIIFVLVMVLIGFLAVFGVIGSDKKIDAAVVSGPQYEVMTENVTGKELSISTSKDDRIS